MCVFLCDVKGERLKKVVGGKVGMRVLISIWFVW